MKLKYITAVFIFAITCESANAQSSCHSFYLDNQQLPNVEECTARVNATMVLANPPDSTKTILWCWAASLSLIYTAEGHPISQEQIISQNFQDSENIQMPTADFLRFADRFNREYVDANGKKFTSSSMQVFSTEDIARSLSEGFPVLFYSFNQHAVVQTSITYFHSFNEGYKMKSGIFWDPIPGFGYGGGSGIYARYSDADLFANNYVAGWSVTTR